MLDTRRNNTSSEFTSETLRSTPRDSKRLSDIIENNATSEDDIDWLKYKVAVAIRKGMPKFKFNFQCTNNTKVGRQKVDYKNCYKENKVGKKSRVDLAELNSEIDECLKIAKDGVRRIKSKKQYSMVDKENLNEATIKGNSLVRHKRSFTFKASELKGNSGGEVKKLHSFHMMPEDNTSNDKEDKIDYNRNTNIKILPNAKRIKDQKLNSLSGKEQELQNILASKPPRPKKVNSKITNRLNRKCLGLAVKETKGLLNKRVQSNNISSSFCNKGLPSNQSKVHSLGEHKKFELTLRDYGRPLSARRSLSQKLNDLHKRYGRREMTDDHTKKDRHCWKCFKRDLHLFVD